jgi:hypothetical protein
MNDQVGLEGLVLRSSFIFSGTVTARGRSMLKVLQPRPDLIVARFDKALRVNPMLGPLDGKPITVLLSKGSSVESGQNLLFFAESWVHGDHIAVREHAHLPADDKTENQVLQMIASLPERHLQERVASAILIVQAVVREVTRATEIREPITEHAAEWMRATIELREVLKGSLPGQPAGGPQARARRDAAARASLTLYFPQGLDKAWRDWPKLKPAQSAIFLLHTPRPPVPSTAFIAPDPADVQPDSAADTIRRLLGSPPPPR